MFSVSCSCLFVVDVVVCLVVVLLLVRFLFLISCLLWLSLSAIYYFKLAFSFVNLSVF